MFARLRVVLLPMQWRTGGCLRRVVAGPHATSLVAKTLSCLLFLVSSAFSEGPRDSMTSPGLLDASLSVERETSRPNAARRSQASDVDHPATLETALSRIGELEQQLDLLSQQVMYSRAPMVCPPPASKYRVEYDGGWTLRPNDPASDPFELSFELHNQFRYTGFDRDNAISPDAAGNNRIISNRNDFDINRGRLVFRGYAFDPALQFYANIDYSTVASNPIQPLLAWISMDVTQQSAFYMGLGKVPGTWEWQQTSRYTLGAERTMATTFFRPSISAGVWASGDVTEQLHYTVFVGDGFNTLTLRANDLDTNFVYSALAWWEPFGEFGVGFSDLLAHASPVVRLGHGLTTTRADSAPSGEPGAEETVIRLSDGTRLIEPNALGAGRTVNAFDIWLYTAHLGWKYRGCSLSGEAFFRWLRNISTTTDEKLSAIQDQGFFVQGSAFVLPQRLEAFVRTSEVHGDFGTGREVGLGVNWYLFQSRNARFTFEVTDVNDSPTQQARTGFVAGADGTLFRTQLWTFF
ncbi:MAG: porin [Planctomycetota bacterium]